MTLQAAIEELKRLTIVGLWEPIEIHRGVKEAKSCTAIATILNAVVKGELK